jgi:PH/SEC7 domain-containing protein
MASFFRQTPLPTSAFKSRSSSSTNGSTPSSSKNTSLGGAGGPSTPSPASSIHRRVSRTDLDFEQALKGGGTVLIKEGVDIQSLGKSPISPGVNTPTTAGGFGSSSSGFPRFNTPIVVPPTPSPMQAQPPPPIVDISAAEGEEGEEEEDHEVDIDLQTKRRSMFRSPGTSSSPDLATLVRKAKARGGVVGMSLNDEGGGVQETQMALAPPSSFHAMLSPTPEQKRGRSNSTTSSAISSTDSSSQKQGTKGFKADKLLGVEGGVGNDRSRMLMRDGGKVRFYLFRVFSHACLKSFIGI